MPYKILLSLLVASLPALAHAQIYSSVSASSDSGGNTVGSGGKIITGDSSASVQVTTNTSSSNTSDVQIRTSVNGTMHEETASTKGATSVKVMATPQKTTIHVTEGTPPVVVKHEVVAASSEASASTSAGEPWATTTLREAEAGFGARLVLSIQNFFTGLFGWFR
jgi:hypothetical protein